MKQPDKKGKGFEYEPEFIAEVVSRAEKLIEAGESQGPLSEKFGALTVFIQKDGGEQNKPKSSVLNFPALDENGQKLGYEIFVGGNEVPSQA